MNVGNTCPQPADGMLTTVAWDLGTGSPTYALEGAIFVTGSAIQWLRDGLQIIQHAHEVGPLAQSVDDSGGVVVVPAFTGLGSPWWDQMLAEQFLVSLAAPHELTSREQSSSRSRFKLAM